jgi:hypothetical protein
MIVRLGRSTQIEWHVQDHRCVWYWKHHLGRVDEEPSNIKNTRDVQLWEMVPYNLKRFYGMSPCLAFPFRKNREHAGLIEDYGKYREDFCFMNGSTDQKRSGRRKR